MTEPTLEDLAKRVRTLLADNERQYFRAVHAEEKIERLESSPPEIYELGRAAGYNQAQEYIEQLKRENISLSARLDTELSRRLHWRNEAMKLYGAIKHARHVVRFAKQVTAWPKLDKFLHEHAVRYKEVRRRVEPTFEGRWRDQ